MIPYVISEDANNSQNSTITIINGASIITVLSTQYGYEMLKDYLLQGGQNIEEALSMTSAHGMSNRRLSLLGIEGISFTQDGALIVDQIDEEFSLSIESMVLDKINTGDRESIEKLRNVLRIKGMHNAPSSLISSFAMSNYIITETGQVRGYSALENNLSTGTLVRDRTILKRIPQRTRGYQCYLVETAGTIDIQSLARAGEFSVLSDTIKIITPVEAPPRLTMREWYLK